MFKQYRGIIKMFRRYWRAYGGCAAIGGSPYFHISILITALVSDIWMQPQWWDGVLSIVPNLTGFTLGGFAIIVTFGDDSFKRIVYSVDEEEEAEPEKSSLAENRIIKTVLGLFLIFRKKDLEHCSKIDKQQRDSHSFIATVGATFVHFILLQIASLIVAILAKGSYFILKTDSRIYLALDNLNFNVPTLLQYGRGVLWFIGYELFIYALVTAIAATFSIFRLIYTYQTYLDSQ